MRHPFAYASERSDPVQSPASDNEQICVLGSGDKRADRVGLNQLGCGVLGGDGVDVDAVVSLSNDHVHADVEPRLQLGRRGGCGRRFGRAVDPNDDGGREPVWVGNGTSDED